MTQNPEYNINLDVKYAPLELVDVKDINDKCTDDWFNQSLCKVNDCVVRLGIVKGEFHWHKHDQENEFFFVVEGKLIIDLENKAIELLPQQGFTVPRGVMHRTRAPERTVMLMIEKYGVKPTVDE